MRYIFSRSFWALSFLSFCFGIVPLSSRADAAFDAAVSAQLSNISDTLSYQSLLLSDLLDTLVNRGFSEPFEDILSKQSLIDSHIYEILGQIVQQISVLSEFVNDTTVTGSGNLMVQLLALLERFSEDYYSLFDSIRDHWDDLPDLLQSEISGLNSSLSGFLEPYLQLSNDYGYETSSSFRDLLALLANGVMIAGGTIDVVIDNSEPIDVRVINDGSFNVVVTNSVEIGDIDGGDEVTLDDEEYDEDIPEFESLSPPNNEGDFDTYHYFDVMGLPSSGLGESFISSLLPTDGDIESLTDSAPEWLTDYDIPDEVQYGNLPSHIRFPLVKVHFAGGIRVEPFWYEYSTASISSSASLIHGIFSWFWRVIGCVSVLLFMIRHFN